MSIRVMMEKARLSFANGLWKASALEEGQTPKFGADFIIENENTKVFKLVDGKKVQTTMEDVLLEVANDTWKGRGKDMLTDLEASKKCLRRGNTRRNKAGDIYAGYEDRLYVAAKNSTRPTIIGQNKEPLTEADGKPYSGCYVNVSFDVYGNADAKKKGVHASLRGVQFHSEGEAFGGGAPASADEFDDFSTGGSEGSAADFL